MAGLAVPHPADKETIATVMQSHGDYRRQAQRQPIDNRKPQTQLSMFLQAFSVFDLLSTQRKTFQRKR